MRTSKFGLALLSLLPALATGAADREGPREETPEREPGTQEAAPEDSDGGDAEAPRFEARRIGRVRRGAPADGFGLALAELESREDRFLLAIGAACAGLETPGYLTLLQDAGMRRRDVFEGEAPGGGFGFALAAGPDRSGNSVREALVGSPFADANTGAVELRTIDRAGKPERLSPEYRNGQFGAAVLAPEDFDGDGVLDLVVGAPAYEGALGRLDVFSGASFELLHTILGRTPGDAFGSTLADAGDFDGDGRRDFAVGAPFGRRRGVPHGYVRVVSGEDFRILRSAYGRESMGLFGEAVAAPGDLDGDGRADLLVGAPSQSVGGVVDVGCVHLVSGKSGVLLRSWTGEAAGEFFGRALVSGFDLDTDGVDDFAVGAPQASPDEVRQLAGSVRLFSGATGAELLRIDGEEVGGRFGASLLARVAEDGLVLTVGAPARGRTLEVEALEGSVHEAVGTVYRYRVEPLR